MLGLALLAAPWLTVHAQTLDRTGPAALAGSYEWKPVAVGAGGFVTGISADRSGATRVLRTDVYGAYRWLQDEQRWAQLVTKATMPAAMQVQNGANEGVFEVVVAPSDPLRLYMAIKGSMLRSTDAGASFKATAPVGGRVLEFDPNSEYRNHGPFIGVSPSDPDLVVFGTPNDGLWRTEDGGGALGEGR